MRDGVESDERKEYAQITVRSPVNPRYTEQGWEIVTQELPEGVATLRKPLPKCRCN